MTHGFQGTLLQSVMMGRAWLWERELVHSSRSGGGCGLGENPFIVVEPEAETTAPRRGITCKEPPLAADFPDMFCS